MFLVWPVAVVVGRGWWVSCLRDSTTSVRCGVVRCGVVGGVGVVWNRREWALVRRRYPAGRKVACIVRTLEGVVAVKGILEGPTGNNAGAGIKMVATTCKKVWLSRYF